MLDLNEFAIALIILAIHIDNLIIIQIQIWAVVVKLFGKIATKFIVTNIMNSFAILEDICFFSSFLFNVITSFLIVFIIILMVFIFLLTVFFTLVNTINSGASIIIHALLR